MNGGNHSRSGEPSFPQPFQGLQKGLEILLSVVRGPVTPGVSGGSHYTLRKRREPPVVIPEIEPPALPPLCSRTQGWRGYTAAPAPASAGGCSHRPALPCGPFSPPLAKKKVLRRRNESTGPSEGQSPSILRKPPRRWWLARWSWG
jgi:hypothetical protein